MQNPPFNKTDRYKISSYRAFNDKYPRRYDTSIWMRICQTSRWDQAVLSELTPGIESLRVLDVGCATGRMLCQPQAALREIQRVLRTNGRIIIVDPWFPPLLRQAVNLYLRYFMHDGDCRMYTPKSVMRMLEQDGWIDVRFRKVGWYSFLVTGWLNKI